MEKDFCWYDTETSGIDPDNDQIYQSAMVKTDSDLNVKDDSKRNLICRTRLDVVPHPKAFLTHKIDVDLLKSEGDSEFVHARKIQNEFMGSPNGTIICGYNTISFDDEMVRKMFYRSMKNPYEHEWKDGNGRFDLFHVVQAVRAFRPEILKWRTKEDGSYSMRLEHLSADNGIEHESAHDAVSDVLATIGVAKLIKERRPTLWKFCLERMNKQSNQKMLSDQRPLYHVSTLHGGVNANGTLILPLIMDRQNKNKFICLNLRHDPTALMNMSIEEIKHFLFSKKKDLAENSPIVGLLGVHVNKQPIIAAPQIDPKTQKPIYSKTVAERFNIDIEKSLGYADKFMSDPNLPKLLARIQMALVSDLKEPEDAYSQLYSGGFMDPNTNRMRSSLHNRADDGTSFAIENANVAERALSTTDAVRQYDLILRTKWLNFYDRIMNTDNFSFAELSDFVDYLEDRLYKGLNGSLTIDQFNDECKIAMMEEAYSSEDKAMIAKLKDHVETELVATVKALRDVVEANKESVLSENSTNEARQKLKTVRDRIFSNGEKKEPDSESLDP